MTTYKAHIFKQRQIGAREEVRIKLFSADGEPLVVTPSDTPSAIYTAALSNVDNEAPNDTPILWSAAPTYDPSTFILDEDQNIRFARGGIYHVVLFGEIPNGLPVEETWALQLGSMGAFADYSFWAHSTFVALEDNNSGQVRPSLHAEVVCSCLEATSLPVELDCDANGPLTTLNLKAFPRRLGDAIDFSGDNWIPYYLPES